MYNLTHSLKETRFYQEAFQEGFEEGFQEGLRLGKIHVIQRCASRGFSVEDIAQILKISVEEVQEIVQSSNEPKTKLTSI